MKFITKLIIALTFILIVYALNATAYASDTTRLTKCTALTQLKKPCKAYPIKGTTLCYNHSAGNQCTALTKAKVQCKRKASKGSKTCFQHKETL